MTEVINSEFGVNVWWTAPEFIIDAAKAHEALASAGFEADDMPIPSRKNQVSRAAHSFQDRRHKNGRRVTEKTKDGASVAVYGILGRNRKDDDEVGYDQATTITLDKESGRVEAKGELADDFMAALSRYEGAITDADVRYFLRKVIRMTFGISKRPSGGIYFVPDRFVGIIESAQQVLESLGIGARLYVERVMNGEQERAIVWEAVETDINSQIDATLNAVGRIEKRVSAFTNHSDKLNELGELMGIYQNLLGKEAEYEGLSERLRDASETVAEKMSEMQGAKPAKAVKTAKAPKVAKVAKTAKTGTRRSNGVGSKVIEEITAVLSETGTPMHYREIAKVVEARGFELRGSDGAAWLQAWISESFRRGNSPIARIGRGVYGLSA